MQEQSGEATSRESKERSGGPHWSKDYVEHLRTIHFTLIALSLAAVVLASSANPSEIVKAREQINAIGELIREWKQDAVQEAANQAVDDFKKRSERNGAAGRETLALLEPQFTDGQAVITGSDGAKSDFTAHFVGRNWIVVGAIRDYAQGKDMVEPLSELWLEPPTTLREFHVLWDALNDDNEILFAIALSQTAYGYKPPMPSHDDFTKVGVIQWVAPGRTTRVVKCDVQYSLKPVSESMKMNLLRDESTIAYYAEPFQCTPFTDSVPDMLPVSNALILDRSYFRPQDAIIRLFRKNKPVGGSFEHSFPELDDLTKNFEGIRIDHFDPILKAEQSRAGESFEAFGIKFPAASTTRWGILVILAVQLYFWIHLHELGRKLKPDDPGWEVAFIGMYNSRPSQAIFAISAYVLPVCAVAGLGVRGLFIGSFHWPYWLLLVMGVGGSITLGLAGWHNAPRRSNFLP